jgi:hypothetical protein
VKSNSHRISENYWYPFHSKYDDWKYTNEIVYGDFKNMNNDEILDLMNSIGYALNIPPTYLTSPNEQIVLNSNNVSNNISVEDVETNMSHSISVQINHLINNIQSDISGNIRIDSSDTQKLYQQFLMENLSE